MKHVTGSAAGLAHLLPIEQLSASQGAAAAKINISEKEAKNECCENKESQGNQKRREHRTQPSAVQEELGNTA